jgi:hypothetical protein
MKRLISAIAMVLAVTAAPVAIADHMSPDGMGTAGMPNDVHNTRLDVRLSEAPNTCFTDLVQQGDLADDPNRCLDDPECVALLISDTCEVIGTIPDDQY